MGFSPRIEISNRLSTQTQTKLFVTEERLLYCSHFVFFTLLRNSLTLIYSYTRFVFWFFHLGLKISNHRVQTQIHKLLTSGRVRSRARAALGGPARARAQGERAEQRHRAVAAAALLHVRLRRARLRAPAAAARAHAPRLAARRAAAHADQDRAG